MAQNIWIGRANRLGNIGELVSVTIGGKVIKAKVARSFASLNVLVVRSGNGQYYAYPDKVEQQRSIHHREIFKNERKKKTNKYHLDLSYVYFVSSDPDFESNRRGSIYVFDGYSSRLLVEEEDYNNANIRITNFGYGRYRCVNISGSIVLRNNYYDGRSIYPTKLQVFTSETEEVETHDLTVSDINEYPPNISVTSPELYLEDWQDPYYRRWWISDDQIDACIGERFMDDEDIAIQKRIYSPSSLHGFPNLNTATSILTYLSFHDTLTGPLYQESTNYPLLSTTESKELYVTVAFYGPPLSYPSTNYNYGDVCPLVTIKDSLPIILEPLTLDFDPTYLQILDLSIYYEEL